jgi:hypothetical protein
MIPKAFRIAEMIVHAGVALSSAAWATCQSFWRRRFLIVLVSRLEVIV